MGAAFYSDTTFDLRAVADQMHLKGASLSYRSQPPLFESEEEYEAFRSRHAKATVPRVPFGPDYAAPVHIGIDSGSTTVKLVVMDEDSRILFTDYRPNLGNPVPLIRDVLQNIYDGHPALHVASVTTTGYGEDLAQNAFHTDYGVVETVAHFTAARHFMGGKVYVEGMDTADEKLLLAIRQRVGMVFQNPDNQIVATVVEEDVAFAPENLGVPSEEIRRRVDDALEAVDMWSTATASSSH